VARVAAREAKNSNKVNTDGSRGEKDIGNGRDWVAQVAAQEATVRKKRLAAKIEPRREKRAGSKNEMNSRKILRWTRARAQNRGPKTRSSSYKEQKTNSTNKMRKGFLHRIKNRVQHEISVHGTLLLI
jgi:hypothetical protein